MKIKHKDFEDFLMWEFHKDEGSGYLDDDLPDAFDEWLVELGAEDVDRLVSLANIYASIRVTNVVKELQEKLLKKEGCCG